MIFITDGNDTTGNDADAITAAAAATGAEIFAVGVGNGVSASTLDAIASDPDPDHVFTTGDFQGLLDLVDAIVDAVFDASKTVFTVQGGANADAVVFSPVIYDLDSGVQNGVSIHSRVVLQPDGTVEILSWQLE